MKLDQQCKLLKWMERCGNASDGLCSGTMLAGRGEARKVEYRTKGLEKSWVAKTHWENAELLNRDFLVPKRD
jgi:hypothetical protein